MNHAHGTHWTAAPDPRIPHVLPGWNPAGTGPAEHHLDLGEMLIRNVPTDIRGRFGGEPEAYGNSIFIFEVEGLCIGIWGISSHADAGTVPAIGRLDVVMAPVDGGLTLPLPEMIAVLNRLRSLVVIPMHWFSLRRSAPSPPACRTCSGWICARSGSSTCRCARCRGGRRWWCCSRDSSTSSDRRSVGLGARAGIAAHLADQRPFRRGDRLDGEAGVVDEHHAREPRFVLARL